tara:strand:+ start:956 stop:1057 length:102 start_codon:yes stop_codon:yes gene_type:complete
MSFTAGFALDEIEEELLLELDANGILDFSGPEN